MPNAGVPRRRMSFHSIIAADIEILWHCTVRGFAKAKQALSLCALVQRVCTTVTHSSSKTFQKVRASSTYETVIGCQSIVLRRLSSSLSSIHSRNLFFAPPKKNGSGRVRNEKRGRRGKSLGHVCAWAHGGRTRRRFIFFLYASR